MVKLRFSEPSKKLRCKNYVGRSEAEEIQLVVFEVEETGEVSTQSDFFLFLYEKFFKMIA